MEDGSEEWLESHGFTKKENVRYTPYGVEWERGLEGDASLSVVHEHDGNWCCVASSALFTKVARAANAKDACEGAATSLEGRCIDSAKRCGTDAKALENFLKKEDKYGR